MARIEQPTDYKVTLTEYERGWGSKLFDVWYFDNEQEAREAAQDYNQKHNTSSVVPDWYVVAEYKGKV